MKPSPDSLIVTAAPKRRSSAPRTRPPAQPVRRAKTKEIRRSSREIRRSRETRILKERPRRIVPLRKLFLVGLFFLGQGLFFFSELFHLGHIEVNGISDLSRKQVLSHAQLNHGTPVWMLSPSSICNRVMGLHEVRAVWVEIKLPGTVNIRVQERRPAYLVGSTKSTGYYLVDDQGVVLRHAVLPCNLPRVMVSEPLAEGGRLSQGVVPIAKTGLALLNGIVPGKPSSLSIDRLESVTVETTYRGRPLTIRLGTLEHRDYKRDLLRALWARLPASKGRPVMLDLRYSSPVVKMEKPLESSQ